MTTYTKISKATGTPYTNVNSQSKEQYDDPNVLYDDPNAFYDGANLALWSDISKPQILGPELVVNGDFTTNLNDWNPGGSVSWNNGSAEFLGNSFIYQVPTVIVGGIYRLAFDYFTHKDDPVSSPGTIDYNFGAQSTHLSSQNSQPLWISKDYIATQADIDSGVIVYFNQGSNFINIDNVSLKMVINIWTKVTKAT